MIKFTPLIKGIITGVIMIGIFLMLYKTNQPANSPYQYLLDIVYAGGIAWTLVSYKRSAEYNHTFKSIFGQGFRCFMMVTFVMVLFTFIFYSSHPEIAKESATSYREWSIKNETDMLPADRDLAVASYEKRFTITTVFYSVFAFILRGVIFTAAGAAVILMRRKQ